MRFGKKFSNLYVGGASKKVKGADFITVFQSKKKKKPKKQGYCKKKIIINLDS